MSAGLVTAIQFAMQLVDGISALASAGKNIQGAYNEGMKVLKDLEAEKRDPTPAEWERLNNQLDELRAALHSDDATEPGLGDGVTAALRSQANVQDNADHKE